MFYLYRTKNGEIKLTQQTYAEGMVLAVLTEAEVTDRVAFCEGYRKAKQEG